MASLALAVGIVFGTFVPVLGVALEALTEIGEISDQLVPRCRGTVVRHICAIAGESKVWSHRGCCSPRNASFRSRGRIGGLAEY